jgi:hypothetical protein
VAFDSQPETNGRERLRQLASFVRKLPEPQFNMHESGEYWETLECGSPVCIGGWGRRMFATGDRFDLLSFGVEMLGLNRSQASDLFFPGYAPGAEAWADRGSTPYHATPKQAARVIDHLIATGEVDWSAAFAEAPEPVSA